MTPEERLKLLAEQVNSANDLADIYEKLSGILDQQNKSISGYLSAQKEVVRLSRQESLIEKTKKQIKDELDAVQERINDGTIIETAEIIKQKALLEGKVATLNGTLKQIRDERAVIQDNSNVLAAVGNELKDQLISWTKQEFSVSQIWEYLQQFDGAVRKYQLSLGAAGDKAEMIRKQTENSVNASARFGANIKDIIDLQSGLNDLTGRSNVFREKDILDLVAITKGTGMQNEEVTKLVGNMMLFGSSIGDAKDLVQKTVNDTSKMGLNSSKVMKSLSMNIDKMDNYRFQNGVDGLKKMVMASEKFRFSMEGALAAADKFRTLEGLLEAGATMRVLGGEFAKMDEFKLSFLARNKPEEFAVEMAKLTKGMASFNKEAGTFDVTDVDYDKLRVVAEATGREVGDLTKQARELAKMDFAKKQIFAGTDEEKEMIAKLATFQKGSSMGFIQIGDKNVNLSDLTKDQISLYVQQQKTLEERAKDSQNFNETFNNTIMQIKASLLPLLQLVNKGLEKFNSIVDGFRDSSGKLSAWSLSLPVAGLLLGTAGGAIILGLTKGLFSLVGSGVGKLFGTIGTATGGPSLLSGLTSGLTAAVPALLSFAAAAAGVGVAAAGIGWGIGKVVEAFRADIKKYEFTGLEALGGVDFNNIDKLKVLQNFKQSDIDRMNEMFDVLNKINSIDTSKLNALQSLFSNMSFKFTLDGDAVLKNTINVDIAGEKLTKLIDDRVKIVTKKGNQPK